MTPDQTAAAQTAMQIAHSYLQENDNDFFKAIGDPYRAQQLLHAATLAAKQLAMAEQNDPHAKLRIEIGNSEHEYSIPELKAEALLAEGVARYFDKPKKALRIIQQATTFDPSRAFYHYVYGTLAVDYHYRDAINALKHAVILDPQNTEFKKALFSAQNISKGERMVASGVTIARRTGTALRFLWLLFLLIPFIGFAAAIYNGNKEAAVVCFLLAMIYGIVMKFVDNAKATIRRHL